MEKQTLLVRFMNQKIQEYVEPRTMGKHPDGLSQTKYGASIYTSLTDHAFSWIGKKTGVSKALVGNWRGEELFRKQEQEHLESFSELFVKEDLRQHEEARKLTPKQRHGFKYMEGDFDDFADVYSLPLRNRIIEKLQVHTKKDPTILPFVLALAEQNVISSTRGRVAQKKLADLFRRKAWEREAEHYRQTFKALSHRVFFACNDVKERDEITEAMQELQYSFDRLIESAKAMQAKQ